MTRSVAVVDALDGPPGGLNYHACAMSNALSKVGVLQLLVSGRSSPGGRQAILGCGSTLVRLVEGRRVDLLHANWVLGFRSALDQICQASDANLMHSHGIWTFVNHAAAVTARRRNIPLVISPHGVFSKWALNHKRAKKFLAWWLYVRRDLALASVLQATAQGEAHDCRKIGLRNPVAIIPPGFEIDSHPKPPRGPSCQRRLLFLGRIHPVKGLLNLVEAFASVRPPGWRVIIAGPDEGGHRREVEAAVSSAGLDGVFEFRGAATGEEKWELYRQSDLFVLPSLSENFGLVVGEALSSGVPVVTTKATPWEELAAHRCGWWVNVGAEALGAALHDATFQD